MALQSKQGEHAAMAVISDRTCDNLDLFSELDAANATVRKDRPTPMNFELLSIKIDAVVAEINI